MAKAKKEGRFGLSHTFMTVAISLGTAVLTGIYLDPTILQYSHYTVGGLTQGAISDYYLGDIISAVSDFNMSVFGPWAESLGIIEPAAPPQGSAAAAASSAVSVPKETSAAVVERATEELQSITPMMLK